MTEDSTPQPPGTDALGCGDAFCPDDPTYQVKERSTGAKIDLCTKHAWIRLGRGRVDRTRFLVTNLGAFA